MCCIVFFFFKQKTAYEMRISDWSSDVCSSDLQVIAHRPFDIIAVEIGIARDEQLRRQQAMIPVPDFDVDMRGAAIVTPHRPEQLADRIMIVIGIILGHRGSRAIAAVRIGPNPPEQLDSVEIVMAVMVGLPRSEKRRGGNKSVRS